VASIDVRNVSGSPRVFVGGGTINVGQGPVDWAVRAAALGVGEILLTSIDREGTFDGFDLAIISAVASAIDIPVIAHGGAGRRSDLLGPLEVGASAVAAGSLFVFQRSRESVLINYPTRPQI